MCKPKIPIFAGRTILWKKEEGRWWAVRSVPLDTADTWCILYQLDNPEIEYRLGMERPID